MRSLVLAAVAAFAFASAAGADPQGPFHLDHSGKCHDATGKLVPASLCSHSGPPAGATAECQDHTWSLSRHRANTCSGHGGVLRWL
jgi:hypothetical protein